MTAPSVPDLSAVEAARRTVSVTPGDRYHRLVVIAEIQRKSRSVLCRCDCGGETVVRLDHIRSGQTTSCGCVSRKMLGDRSRTHGLRRHPAYRSWSSMVSRTTPGSAYQRRNPNYLGVGREPRWDDFAAFWKDMGATWFDGAVLGRYGDQGHYTPSNCRWITKAENVQEAHIRHLTSDGRYGAEVADEYGINRNTYRDRLKRGWSVDQAATTPVRNPAARAGED